MEIFERIRILRKQNLKLSQEQFGKKLGVSRTVIKNIELGDLKHPEQKEPLYKLICKEFNVRYEWLITGEGEMFNETQEDYFDKLAEQYGLGDYARKILEFYGLLDEEHKKMLEKFIYQAATIVLENNIATARKGVDEAIANNETDKAIVAANLAFDKAFPYSGIGNVADSEISAFDKAIPQTNNIASEVKKTIESGEEVLSRRNTSKK